MAARPTDARRLHLGSHTRSPNEEQFLSTRSLTTGLHLLGAPGMGKTNALLHFFTQVATWRDGPIFVFSPKGALIPNCRDWTINVGQASRLVVFDPGNRDWLTGYDPLKPNALSVDDHARHVRESFRAGMGQASFDNTQQLARFSYATFYALRAGERTLADATELWRPDSSLRGELLPLLENHEVRDDLSYFDALPLARKDQLIASTLARLLAFVAYPRVRQILTARDHSLDVGKIIEQRKICLVNLEEYRPLGLDDIRMLGRFLLNDIVRHAFGDRDRRVPITLILDEAQTWVTKDLCTLLEQGREMNVRVLLAHHYLDQLKDADDRRLLESVLQCAMVKGLFGHGWVPNYEPFMRHFFVDQFDPKKVKHQETTLESRQVETTRVVLGETRTKSRETGEAHSSSSTGGGSHTTSSMQSRGTLDGRTSAYVQSDGFAFGDVTLPDGTVVPSETMSGSTTMSHGEQHSDTETEGETESDSANWSETESDTVSESRSSSLSKSKVVQPFHEVHQRRVPSSTTFESEEEFYTQRLQETAAQPKGRWVVKVPGHPACFLQLPLVQPIPIGSERLRRVVERIYGESPYCIRRRDVAATNYNTLELRKDYDHAVTNNRPRRKATDPTDPQRGGNSRAVRKNPFRGD